MKVNAKKCSDIDLQSISKERKIHPPRAGFYIKTRDAARFHPSCLLYLPE